MDWLYDGKAISEEDFEGYIGFVYLIENKTNGRKYIGQKKAWSHKFSVKTNPVTKKKKKTKIIIPSDWRKYWGSSIELQGDVATLGEENFTRTVLRLCKTKGLMNYFELKEQMNNDVLLDETYYNAFVGGKIHRKHVIGKTDV